MNTHIKLTYLVVIVVRSFRSVVHSISPNSRLPRHYSTRMFHAYPKRYDLSYKLKTMDERDYKAMNRELNDVPAQVFYHGTNREGICGIIKSRYVGTKYFDGYGVFLTTDIEDALNHGQYVLIFNNLNLVCEKDEVNDGYYYRGKIKIDLISKVFCNPNDKRVIKDLADGLQYWQ